MYDENLRNNRIYNSSRMFIISVFYMIVSTIVPFVVRTLMIYYLGDVYAGINSVLVSIISLLSMTDLGLGTAIVFFLYDPVAKSDKAMIQAYLNVLRKAYCYIGITILIIGLLLTPFLSFFVGSDIPNDVNIYVIFIVYVVSIVIPYMYYPEIQSYVFAIQRGDVINAANFISNIVAYMIQILAIVCIRSFSVYFIALFIQTLLNCCFRRIIKSKFCSEIVPDGKLDLRSSDALKKKVVALLGHQMDEKFIASIDNLVLSHFCGLVVVTVYGNYMYVVSAVFLILSSVFDSISASMGNAIVTETKESNYVRFNTILWMNGMLVVWVCACLACMYQPFMTMWMVDRLFPVSTMALFVLYFFIIQIRRTVLTFKNVSGMWWEDRYKPYVSMVVNLLMDIILVKHIGVNGALISSIMCIAFIEIPWEANVLCSGLFEKNVFRYLIKVLSYLSLAIINSGVVYILSLNIFRTTDIVGLIFRGVFASIISTSIIFVVYHNSNEMKAWKGTLKLILKKL